MKARVRSGKQMLIRLFCVMAAVTLGCFAVLGVYSLSNTQEELAYCNEAALDVFCTSLEYAAEDLEAFNQSLFSSGVAFDLLGVQENVPVEQLLLSEMNLRQLSRNRTTANTGIYLFQKEGGYNAYTYGSAFLGGFVRYTHIMADIRAYWLNQPPEAFQRWTLYEEDDTVLLLYASRRNDLFSCVMIDLDAYTQSYHTSPDASIEYTFFDDGGILTNARAVAEAGLSPEDLRADDRPVLHLRRSVILHTRALPHFGISLGSMISFSGVWASFRIYIILLMATLLLLGGIFLFLYRYIRRMLIYPLDEISEASRRIAAGSTDIQPREEPVQELTEIHDALRNLVEQKVTLEQNRVNEAQEKEHALLQYYQLQTRSHFFLNCLKSIFNMVSRGERETTMRIITLFSNHLRYVFRDSLSLVPVRAELNEVEDYFHIIELERSDHILLVKNINPQLMDYPIPPLVIQTFLENFNKHNAQSSRILRFSIQIDQVSMEERDYVRLRLSDNGVGYDRKALKSMGAGTEVFPQFHVGIQNLLRRMDILYHGQHQAAFYNNPGGGACSVIYLPYEPQEAVKTEEEGA